MEPRQNDEIPASKEHVLTYHEVGITDVVLDKTSTNNDHTGVGSKDSLTVHPT